MKKREVTVGLLDILGLSSEQRAPTTDASHYNMVNEPLRLSDKNPQRRRLAQEKFRSNYAHLNNQLPKEWQTVLSEVAANPRGQEVIANMPDNVDIDMRGFFSSSEITAAYFHEQNVLELSSIDENGRTGRDGSADPYNCFLHESRHAMQDHLGLRLGINGNRARDIAHNNLLIEADSHAFANSESVVKDTLGSANPTQAQVRSFMQKDLVQEAFSKVKTQNMHPADVLAVRKNIEQQVQKTPQYRFQQALKKSGGNVEGARKAFRTQEFNRFWKSGVFFSSKYERQALNAVVHAAREGELTTNGQRAVVSKINNQIAKENGVSVSEIENGPKVSPAFKKCLNYVEEHQNLSSGQMREAFNRIYDNEDRNGNLAVWQRRQEGR